MFIFFTVLLYKILIKFVIVYYRQKYAHKYTFTKAILSVKGPFKYKKKIFSCQQPWPIIQMFKESKQSRDNINFAKDNFLRQHYNN